MDFHKISSVVKDTVQFMIYLVKENLWCFNYAFATNSKSVVKKGEKIFIDMIHAP